MNANYIAGRCFMPAASHLSQNAKSQTQDAKSKPVQPSPTKSNQKM
ncbi:MAG TPA: hypothetical protein VGI03_07100 [Verrucomicrobiae bacterium]